MGPQRVFLDANILFSRTLRDWLFQLRRISEGDLFTISTSEDAIVEVQSRFRKENPEIPGQVISRFRTQVSNFCDEVASDYQVIEVEEISDEQDWHIHAAALALAVDLLITTDKGFLSSRDSIHRTFSYEVLHPDEFLILVDDNWPHLVRQVTDLQSRFWASKEIQTSKPSKKLRQALEDAGCPSFAAKVQTHLKALAGV